MVQNRFEETLQVSTNLLKLMTGWKLKTPNIFVKWGSYFPATDLVSVARLLWFCDLVLQYRVISPFLIA
jgi:hypothetical protein